MPGSRRDVPAAEPLTVRETRHVRSSALAIGERLLRRREFGPLLGAVVLVVIFSSLTDKFFSPQEFSGLTSLASSVGIAAIGVTFLMIAGEFDLSVGAVFALSEVLFGKLLSDLHMTPILALLAVLGIAVLIGLVNGVVTTGFGIPSFITTLAMLMFVQGVDVVISQGNTILFFGHSWLITVMGGRIGQGIAAPVIWLIVITLVVWYVLEHTRYGNWVRAAGGRTGVARTMGVPTSRVKIYNFIICSMVAAWAGCTQFASYGAASAADGQDLELFAIVATVIGGTSLFGVSGTIIGTFIGAVILGLLQTGLVLVGVPGSWYTPAIGVILVIAVIVNVRLSKLTFSALRARFSLRPAFGLEDEAAVIRKEVRE
jgi:simple sugar transport system permease protein